MPAGTRPPPAALAGGGDERRAPASSSALLAGVEADEREAAERRAEESVVREPLGEVDRGLRVLLRHLQPLAEAEDQAQLLVQPGALLDRRAGLPEGSSR